MGLQSLGSLGSTASSFNSFNLNVFEPTDVFQFSIGSTRNINLSLNNKGVTSEEWKLITHNCAIA
ncbi:hypothetical protein [Nostoc sp.]|uniref:hypothetical protein n=1 Tax=Nostoc sp. TaxID=1180 RepID=UPI002FF827E6